MLLYERVLRILLNEGTITSSAAIIVTCGGPLDAHVLNTMGFRDVTISNLDIARPDADSPIRWDVADAEALPYEENAFEWGVVHAGLHHCRSPVRGLLELLRVSSRGIIVFEARDSFMMRLAIRLGFVPEYELEAVALEGGTGGLRNGPIPNFIYRWTEREVRKTVESAYPATENEIRFFYGVRLPEERLTMSRPLKRFTAKILGAGARTLQRILPSQANELAFVIRKTGKNKPWIDGTGLAPNYDLGFDISSYVKGFHHLDATPARQAADDVGSA